MSDVLEYDMPTKADQSKFDIQLREAQEYERYFAGVLTKAKIHKVEVKCENYQWETTGNIFVEYECRGKKSGIAVTEADHWSHILRRNDEILVSHFLTIERIKKLAARAFREGRFCTYSGDGKLSKGVLIPILWIVGLDAKDPHVDNLADENKRLRALVKDMAGLGFLAAQNLINKIEGKFNERRTDRIIKAYAAIYRTRSK